MLESPDDGKRRSRFECSVNHVLRVCRGILALRPYRELENNVDRTLGWFPGAVEAMGNHTG